MGAMGAQPPPGAPTVRTAYAANLRAWPALAGDLDLSPFVPGSEAAPVEVKPYVWLSQGGWTTPLHYDMHHNFYHQLRGRKRFVLLPPSAHRELGLWPALHPAHRSAARALTDAELAGGVVLRCLAPARRRDPSGP